MLDFYESEELFRPLNEQYALNNGEADDADIKKIIYDILKRFYGYRSFRGMQEEIILHLIKGGDATVLMPTGGGKSLCYQIPSIVRPGMGLVISPLIALMQDQVTSLISGGIRAAFLNSSLTPQEIRRVYAQIYGGNLDILYISPERAVMDGFMDRLREIKISLIAVDEAHCISQWGHDFRPEYTQLSSLREAFRDAPWIALTATADEVTRRDIAKQLQLEEARSFITSFDRPNICYYIKPQSSSPREIRQDFLRFLKEKHQGDAGIVYCMTRRQVEETAEWLCEEGYEALPYHAGLPDSVRADNQNRFLQEEGIIMAATVAFGMGIDKPNVRFVAHLSLPGSVEAYYQETGRAGRDGLPASAWMEYNLRDIAIRQSFIENSESDELHKNIDRRKLKALLGFCESAECRRHALLAYFGEDSPRDCGGCDNCLEPPESVDGLILAQKALSCVFRTGQVFGVNYLIDVLLGKKNEKIINNRHDKLTTYGIGTELSPHQWQSVFRQLTAGGFLKVELGEKYSSLRLNENSWDILKGRTSLKLRLEKKKSKVRTVKAEAGLKTASGENRGQSIVLFGLLRQKRLELARREGMPPYVILHDRSLLEISKQLPQSLDELQNVYGFGELRIKKYGQEFLTVVKDYLKDNPQ
ncbi:DNA helicase RecQ [bacterium]|nr:DNA helicase RecQ [bacterium]